jgi:dTMP kinase
MSQSMPYRGAPAQSETRSVLAIVAFRKLWNSMAFSSFGDWLGLLASTAFASELAGGRYSKANYAIAGVFIVRLLPAVLLGPIAGVIADRFDRKRLMIFCDIIRFGLFISIPLVGSLTWLYVATVLVEVVTLFWQPAKEASVPNLVPKHKLEGANQLSLLAAYGTAPIAALVFTLLAFISEGLSKIFPDGYTSTADLGLFIDGLSFLFIAWTVLRLDDIPRGSAMEKSEDTKILRSFIDGFKFITQSKLIRGLIIGMLGAFFAAGAVVGLARTYVIDLHAGDAAYGVLFASVFSGLALGAVIGPKFLSQFSRRRTFGAALVVASLCLVVISIVPNLVLAIIFTVLLGAFAGVSWVTGYTLLGGEVEDEIRGRTFAFVFTLTRISLVLVLAVAPIVAAAIGKHNFEIFQFHYAFNGAEFTMLTAGIIGIIVGVFSYHQMKDRPGISFINDIRAALRGELAAVNGFNHPGLFIAYEGGEGSGKSTQSEALKKYLESIGEKVTLTREPGGTPLGVKLREILLAQETGSISPRSEALLYAADRAHHVYSKIRPALEEGEVVITDRYIDSSIAYQGAGRVLEPSEVTRVSRWATENLTPNITIVLDLPASIGLGRLTSRDRLEAEPVVFHERVRQEFLNLASLDPERYLVVDATLPSEEITQLIIEKVAQHPALLINQKKTRQKKVKGE